ncbi:DUF58 domain-containing protein [Aquihabitans sp. G128]|uniref:DUF58 domain-containing protein n=1 Tax=Aquihabitans sp. G128 TaxID=2849779 RepID=UPI001C239638|nr:DUF58 domain-containing protein [Aquihabitans sp. G128]QXC62285.1 DUF58 domain-containing protein [Aquihabitans sp. G128]
MITRSGTALAVASVAVLVAGRVFGLPELYLMGATGLVLVAAAVVQVRRPVPRLDVERVVHPRRVHLGGQSRVELRITNVGQRRAPVLTLHDPVAGTIGARVSLAPLGPDDRQAASYRLPTERRGLVRAGPLQAERTDAFGLARRRFPVAEQTALTVLPAIEPLVGLAAGGGLDDPLAGVAHPVLGSAGDEDFATLRPYVVGDDLRRVHWASTARSGDLLVRQDDPPWQGHLTVLLDAREGRLNHDRFEQAVSAAASLLHAVAARGDRARLVITDGVDTGLVDARAGRDTLLERLALVERHPGERLPEVAADGRSRTGGLVLVTGAPDAADLAALAAHRSRFASVRIVSIADHLAAPAGRAGAPDLVPVPPGGSFAAAWSAALRPAGRS